MGFRDGVAPMQRRLFDNFGEPASYVLAGQAPRSITVVFRAAGARVTLDTGETVTTRSPLLDLKVEDLAPFRATPNRDTVTLRGQTWTVEELWNDDGEGVQQWKLTDPRRVG